MSVVPLFLLWLWQRATGGSGPPSVPTWPTTASPPPMPAFVPHPASTPSADTGTPLADLHTKASTAPTTHHEIVPHAAQPKTRAAPAAQSARQTATHAATQAATHAASQAARSVHVPTLREGWGLTQSKSPAVHDAAVSDLQSILIARGAKLKRDGLYGPNTARAWSTLAKQQKLSPTIARVGPKTARVATHTYDVLSVPPIP
jgi:hypothetical protein